MADLLLPPWLNIARLHTDYLDNTGTTRALYTAAPETTGFGGDRLKLSLEFVPTSSRQTPVERAAVRTFLARLRGRQNRAYLYDPSYRQRGSFPAPELLSNNTFANGTIGWEGFQASPTTAISVADRILRAQVIMNDGASGLVFNNISGVSLTQFAPYLARAMLLQGNGDPGSIVVSGTSKGSGVNGGSSSSLASTYGLRSVAFVAQSASPYFFSAGGTNPVAGQQAGHYLSSPYTSLSRCALVDNGPNALLQSDTLGTTWTQTGLSSLASNAATAPDGTVTADTFVENSANSSHGISQSQARANVAADLCAYGYFARGSGTRNIRLYVGNDGSNLGHATFDLGAGTFGSVTNLGTATNARAFIVPAGGNIYFCSVVARLPAAATIACFVGMHNGTSDTYTGNGTSSVSGWRVGAAVSSVPTRGALTTTTVSAGTSQTGSALYIKGLPASTNGLLLPDDRFEVITSRGSEMKIVTAALNSDAAGLGYLQFEPPLLGIPADNAPIIINQPMTRAIFAGDVVGWDDAPGMLTTASAEFEEAA